MANERKENVKVVRDGNYERRERVVEHDLSTQQTLVNRTNQLLTLVGFVIVIALMIRVVLRLIAANAGNAFVDFIYDVTNVLVAPFQTIVASPAFDGGNVFDTGAMIAIVIYAIATWILVTLISILFSDSGGTRQITSYEQVG